MTPSQQELLRNIALSVGRLAAVHLEGDERGALLTLSMVLETLLCFEADTLLFLGLKEKFGSLPTPSLKLRTLYDALLGVCDLAVVFDEDEAEGISSSLLSLYTTETQMN
jgi:hypothetical protein